MTYRKRKKQCKRRLEQRQRLTESQRYFCRIHRLSGYLLKDTGIGFSEFGKKISNDFTKVTKSLATALNEFGKRFFASFSKIDWQGLNEGIIES